MFLWRKRHGATPPTLSASGRWRNREINAAFVDPKMTHQIAELGGTPLAGSPADFGKLIAKETEKWGKVIRAGHIKPE